MHPLSRTKAYKDKVRQDMKDKADLAFQEMEEEIMKTIKVRSGAEGETEGNP